VGLENKMVTMEEFLRINLCVGKIVSAERIPNKQKILKAIIDIGSELREVIVGAAEYYEPDELDGRIVVICTNLTPKKMGNITSAGMLLAAEGVNGKPVFLTTSDEAPIGSVIR
jgi:methionine--tRNA ligase beta chain